MISRLPPRLRPGDRVRLVSPASRPDPAQVQRGAALLSDWGLRVEIAAHAFDSWGHYLAGRDQDRLADLDEAFRDPGVRAVLSTTGGKGSYRIVDRLAFAAIGRDPKPFVGFSDLTSVHLARWQHCGVPGFHGPHMAWNDDYYGAVAAERLRAALMDTQPVVMRQDRREPTAAVTTSGVATGILMGGTLGVMSSAVGWACPPLEGMILVIEGCGSGDWKHGSVAHAADALGSPSWCCRSGCGSVHSFRRSAVWEVVDDRRARGAPVVIGCADLGRLADRTRAGSVYGPVGHTGTPRRRRWELTVEPGVS